MQRRHVYCGRKMVMKKRTIMGAATLAMAAAIVLRKSGLKEDVEWELAEKPGKVIDIDGYGVHYLDSGSGSPIVLIHGFGGQTYSYRHLTPLFEAAHRVVAVDLKGYGYSERDAGAGLSHTDQVAMLKTLLAKLGVDRATFVGHSMGGAIIQRLAAAHPAMVESLVLVASATGEEHFSRRILPPRFVLRAILPLLARVAASRLLTLSYYDPDCLTDDVRAEYNRPARLRGSMDGLMAIMRDSAADPPIDASAIAVPVLLLNGADDRAVPLSAAQRIRARIPQARLIVIDRAGHMLLEERPAECARAIVDFLHDVPVASAARSSVGA